MASSSKALKWKKIAALQDLYGYIAEHDMHEGELTVSREDLATDVYDALRTVVR